MKIDCRFLNTKIDIQAQMARIFKESFFTFSPQLTSIILLFLRSEISREVSAKNSE